MQNVLCEPRVSCLHDTLRHQAFVANFWAKPLGQKECFFLIWLDEVKFSAPWHAHARTTHEGLEVHPTSIHRHRQIVIGRCSCSCSAHIVWWTTDVLFRLLLSTLRDKLKDFSCFDHFWLVVCLRHILQHVSCFVSTLGCFLVRADHLNVPLMRKYHF